MEVCEAMSFGVLCLLDGVKLLHSVCVFCVCVCVCMCVCLCVYVCVFVCVCVCVYVCVYVCVCMCVCVCVCMCVCVSVYVYVFLCCVSVCVWCLCVCVCMHVSYCFVHLHVLVCLFVVRRGQWWLSGYFLPWAMGEKMGEGLLDLFNYTNGVMAT